jgi:hypothetical protein
LFSDAKRWRWTKRLCFGGVVKRCHSTELLSCAGHIVNVRKLRDIYIEEENEEVTQGTQVIMLNRCTDEKVERGKMISIYVR